MKFKRLNLKIPEVTYQTLVQEKSKRIPRTSVTALIVEAVMEKYERAPARGGR